MMKHTTNMRCACGMALGIALLGACEIEDEQRVEPEPVVPVAGDAVAGAEESNGEPACAADEVSWSMLVHAGRSGPALAGARVCQMDSPNAECGDTDAEGRWEGCLPASSDVALTFEKEGYAPLLYPIRTGEEPPELLRHTDIQMTDNAQATGYWGQVDVEFPPTSQALVLVQVHAYDEDVSRFSYCLEDVSITSSPEPTVGPSYFDIASRYDPDATATNVAVCFALFAFDDTVDTTMTLSHPTLDRCEHIDGGWRGDEPGTLRVPARAGFRTYVHAVCH